MKLAVRAIWPILDGLRILGHDVSAILHSSGLDRLDLKNPDASIPHAAAMGLWDQGVRITGDADLGLHVAECAREESFDLHAYLMSACATLGDAYALMCRYQQLVHTSTRVELEVDGKWAALRHILPGDRPVPRQPAEFLLAVWLRTGRKLIGHNWNPEEVHFAHSEPKCVAEHQRVFNAPVRFAAPGNRLVFSAALLDETCVGADPGMLTVLSRLADQALERQPRTDTWADRVRSIAAEELRGGSPSVERIAARLHMSTRTLQRRLAAEGTTYGELLDRLRRQLAANYLADARFSIAEVAFLLGYADLTSFHRAVKRWTGTTPSTWRAGIMSS